jgi:hypothetical protein
MYYRVILLLEWDRWAELDRFVFLGGSRLWGAWLSWFLIVTS